MRLRPGRLNRYTHYCCAAVSALCDLLSWSYHLDLVTSLLASALRKLQAHISSRLLGGSAIFIQLLVYTILLPALYRSIVHPSIAPLLSTVPIHSTVSMSTGPPDSHTPP